MSPKTKENRPQIISEADLGAFPCQIVELFSGQCRKYMSFPSGWKFTSDYIEEINELFAIIFCLLSMLFPLIIQWNTPEPINMFK